MIPTKIPEGRIIIEYRVIFAGCTNGNYISNHNSENEARRAAREHSEYIKDDVNVVERAINNGYSDNRLVVTYRYDII